jgi:hypothetical protein
MHNLQVTEYCLSGLKTLVTHHKDPMSLQKIQVEMDVVQKMGEQPNEDDILNGNEIDLGAKIWRDFKNWRKEE